MNRPRILVVQLKRIGDLVLTTPLLRTLRCRYPDAQMTLALEAGCRELIGAIGSVDEFLVYRRGAVNAGLWLRLGLSRFDLCLDATGTQRSALFASLSKAGKRIGFTKSDRNRTRDRVYNHPVQSSVRRNHTVDHYLNLLAPLGEGRTEPDPRLDLPEQSETRAARLLRACGIKGRYVVVHPGAAREEKLWLPERWAEVIAHCTDRLGLECLLTGTGASFEKEHCNVLRAALTVPFHDLTGRLDLLTLCALIKGAKLYLGVDSGPMHLASATSTPIVALFGPTHAYHWHPRRSDAIVIQAGAAGRPLTPDYSLRPTEDITCTEVIGAIDKLLEA